MPDSPPGKRREPGPLQPERKRPPAGYAELHCCTNFSFLTGASHPDELAQRAAELGYAALAVTDRNSLAGIVRAHDACQQLKLKLLIGAELNLVDAPPLVVLATDRAAYARLCRLLTRGRRNAQKGECRLTLEDLAEHAAGLLGLVLLPPLLSRDDAEHQLAQYHELFGDRCYALAERHLGTEDARSLARMQKLARDAAVPLACSNDVHYHVRERRCLQDVLTAVRHGCTVADLGERMFPNGERYLKSPRQMATLFREWPDAVARTVEIADRCHFSLDELRYEYPEELAPPGLTPLQHLTTLTWEGARRRYPQGVPEHVQTLIKNELKLIGELRYEAYFLTVWDLVKFARSRGILCQGRGSAANSAVCYCLEVTSVDPAQIATLFERFISKERGEAPDIDIDFEHERREEVIQYVYDKYGRERSGMTAVVITYRGKSATRDVGKALGLSADRIDALANLLHHYSDDQKLAERFHEAGLNLSSRLGQQLVILVRELLGFPRHLSQHPGGLVITHSPLCELVPIENATMPGRTVVEWDKSDLDALGILKVDCLALGMLTAIRKGFDLVQRHYGRSLTLANIPQEDPAVYGMISRADTVGVFQIESRAQMTMLPRLKPQKFYDLVIEVAIVRPGPIQGNMVHPYLRRRNREEPVEYPSREVQNVLEKTLGVPLFQEQAMKLVMVAGGFTPGEADQLRRAMGAWRKTGVMDRFEKKLIAGMLARGYSHDFAERLFNQIRGFGEYGFPESHAASFALLVYVSAWIKHYYPAVFTAALINSQPMGFYAPAQLVSDARKHDVEVRPVDVNFSEWDCTLEGTKGSGVFFRPLESDLKSSLVCGGLKKTPDPLALNNHLCGGRSGDGGSEADSKCSQSRGAETCALTRPAATLSHKVGEGFTKAALRLGMRMLKGLSEVHARQIVAARDVGPFMSYQDFVRRTKLPAAALARLARADAFHSLTLDRRAALWQSLPEQNQNSLFSASEVDEAMVKLPLMSPQHEVTADYQSSGLSLRAHPLKFLRPWLEQRGVVRAVDLATLDEDRRYRVAGLVLMRQRPGTASGITFVTLEDETGTANLIVHPNTWERYQKISYTAKVWIARGMLQRQDSVIHLVVDQLEDATERLDALNVPSRDFR